MGGGSVGLSGARHPTGRVGLGLDEDTSGPMGGDAARRMMGDDFEDDLTWFLDIDDEEDEDDDDDDDDYDDDDDVCHTYDEITRPPPPHLR